MTDDSFCCFIRLKKGVIPITEQIQEQWFHCQVVQTSDKQKNNLATFYL